MILWVGVGALTLYLVVMGLNGAVGKGLGMMGEGGFRMTGAGWVL